MPVRTASQASRQDEGQKRRHDDSQRGEHLPYPDRDYIDAVPRTWERLPHYAYQRRGPRPYDRRSGAERVLGRLPPSSGADQRDYKTTERRDTDHTDCPPRFKGLAPQTGRKGDTCKGFT